MHTSSGNLSFQPSRYSVLDFRCLAPRGCRSILSSPDSSSEIDEDEKLKGSEALPHCGLLTKTFTLFLTVFIHARSDSVVRAKPKHRFENDIPSCMAGRAIALKKKEVLLVGRIVALDRDFGLVVQGRNAPNGDRTVQTPFSLTQEIRSRAYRNSNVLGLGRAPSRRKPATPLSWNSGVLTMLDRARQVLELIRSVLQVMGSSMWFCHFDDDNYVNVPRLLKLLDNYNPREDWYLGKPSIPAPLEIIRQGPEPQKRPIQIGLYVFGLLFSKNSSDSVTFFGNCLEL
ncbi:Fringe glycosyltransferase [Acromyrmex echinatior]|uniref:Fringe glycosyltransferase n=1 Tax=Acromyrmex echinatior TaxID=103372 RepID=F4W510_ACREC|nr:Fringe glycosyltransferase [Acromyrmex echinatior]